MRFEQLLQEGECVVFANRRVLHARREFDTETGERWLKGTYVEWDDFQVERRPRSLMHFDVSLSSS